MKKQYYYLIVPILLIVYTIVTHSTEPRPPHRFPKYISEIWRGGAYDAQYPVEASQDTGLLATIDHAPNEPVEGYPMRSGIVEGISDTFIVNVHLYNRNSEDYDISSYQPDNWFEPVIYDIHADPWKSHPLPQPYNFGYSFQYWKNWFEEIVTQPNVIPYSGNMNVRYSLVYYVWGLPAGRFRVMMEKTSYAPPGFRIILTNVPSTWIMKPTDLADTLTAFAACFWRAQKREDYNTALSWTDSIFAHNSNSVIGYALKTYADASLRDSTALLADYDSTLAILERQGDPLLPDTSDMNKWERMWYDDQLMITRYTRWRHVTGTDEVLH